MLQSHRLGVVESNDSGPALPAETTSMALDSSLLLDTLRRFHDASHPPFEGYPGSTDHAAERWADAYTNFVYGGQTTPLAVPIMPSSLALATEAMRGVLAGFWAAPPFEPNDLGLAAYRGADAIGAFWLQVTASPAAVFLGAQAVVAIPTAAALQGALLAALIRGAAVLPMLQAVVSALDTYTRTVVVQFPPNIITKLD
jgi:hypothetical protein